MNGESLARPGDIHALTRCVGSFRAPEALFQPSFLGLEASGIHETTWVLLVIGLHPD
jgi:hypothetical protein